jgi:hypothetical protein
MKHSGFSVVRSPFHPLHRKGAMARPGWPIFLGQSAGSLLLLLVMTAGALAILATISVLTSTKDLVGSTNVKATQIVEIQPSGDERQLPPQP